MWIRKFESYADDVLSSLEHPTIADVKVRAIDMQDLNKAINRKFGPHKTFEGSELYLSNDKNNRDFKLAVIDVTSKDKIVIDSSLNELKKYGDRIKVNLFEETPEGKVICLGKLNFEIDELLRFKSKFEDLPEFTEDVDVNKIIRLAKRLELNV